MCDITEPNYNRNLSKWVRYKLAHEGQLLVLSDHNGGIEQISGNLSAKVAGQSILLHAQPFIGVIPDIIHTVAHTDAFERVRMPNAFFSAECTSKRVIVLHVSTTGSVNDASIVTQNDKGNKFLWLSEKDKDAFGRVKLWLPQFMRLDFATGEKIAEIANSKDRSKASDYEKDYGYLLDIILPGRVENLLAFRLLCEAKQLCGGATEVDVNGITIHAPTTLEEWLAPFGKKDEQDIVHVAGLIGSDDIKAKVEAVLNAISNTQKLNSAIEAFFQVLEASSHKDEV